MDLGIKDNREAGLSSSEEEKILEHAYHFFESQSHRFDPFIVKSQPKSHRAGFFNESKNGHGSGDYYVFVKTFKNELCKGFEPRVVEKCLLKKGLLKANTAGKVGEPIWVPSYDKSIRLYHFLSLVLGEKVKDS